MSGPYFGAAVRRVEDKPLLSGQALFVDDVSLPDMLHAALVRSPYAHAKILNIDSAAALDRDHTADGPDRRWGDRPLSSGRGARTGIGFGIKPFGR